MGREFKERIHEQLRRNRNALWIGRIPISTKQQFIKLAENEFEDHYGFTLKWLMDNALADAKWENLDMRLTAVENKLTEEPKKRTMLDGKTEIKVRK